MFGCRQSAGKTGCDEGIQNPQRLNARGRFAIDHDTVRALQRCKEVRAVRMDPPQDLSRGLEVKGKK